MSRDDVRERVQAHLRSLAVSLPELVERVRDRAAAEGRTAPQVDPEQERQRLSAFAAYLERFGGVDSGVVGPVDLRDILEQAVALARPEIEPKARLHTTYLRAPLVDAHPRQLGQVFISLLINAAQAIPGGAPEANAVGVELDTTDKGWARVAIADTGEGIDPNLLRMIFEPLFSTKRGAGMGIGLAVTREIIQEHGGGIYVDTTRGAGTMFIIELPPAE
jgi:signal transduction histidine kinase